MIKAHLYCPQESIFRGNLLLNRPTLPGQRTKRNAATSRYEVNVLSFNGNKALVLLPNVMATKDNETALIDIKYLRY